VMLAIMPHEQGTVPNGGSACVLPNLFRRSA
jgi:hypothetical protein